MSYHSIRDNHIFHCPCELYTIAFGTLRTSLERYISLPRESDDLDKDDMTDAEIAKIVVVHPTPPTFKKHPQVKLFYK